MVGTRVDVDERAGEAATVGVPSGSKSVELDGVEQVYGRRAPGGPGFIAVKVGNLERGIYGSLKGSLEYCLWIGVGYWVS